MPKCDICRKSVPLWNCIQQQVKAGSIGNGFSWRSGTTRRSNNQRGRSTSSYTTGKWGWNSGRNLFKTVYICKECANIQDGGSSLGCFSIVLILCLLVGFCTFTKTSNNEPKPLKDSANNTINQPEISEVTQQSNITEIEAALPEINATAKDVPDQKIDQNLSNNQAINNEPESDAERNLTVADETKEAVNPNVTSLSKKSTEKAFVANFKGPFGQVVAVRDYPTETMKNQALDLWSRERSILETDGSVTHNELPSQSNKSPLTGY